MATTSTSALFTRSWASSKASGTPKRLLAAAADSRRLVESAVISKSSASDFNAGMCACAAHPRSGLAPMMPTRILLDIGDSLARISQSAFFLQPVLDLIDPLFTGSERCGAGMHGVASEHEIVRMSDCQAKNEFRIGLCIDNDRVIRRLEDRKFAGF